MSEKKKVTIVNLITGSRIIGTLLLPLITSVFGPLGTAIYIGSLWATDAIDGYLAKKRWKVSTIFGANLDAFSDKVLGIASLLYLRSFYPGMIMPVFLEIGIFATNFAYGRKGADVKSSSTGKLKTVFLGAITALSIFSTISLTSVLAKWISPLIGVVLAMQVITLEDYIKTHKNYLKTHKPKNDVSHMGFFKTIKTIIKKLGDKNLYSPTYYKKHKNEPLLDMLLNNQEGKEESINKNTETSLKNSQIDIQELTHLEKTRLKSTFNLNDEKLEKILNELNVKQNKSYEEIKNYLVFHPEIYKNDKQWLKETEITSISSQESKTLLKKLDKNKK